jgi:TMEM175 potassium channel family protein
MLASSKMVNTSYNRFAGGSVERLAALSDGIFAVAMTLLLLDLHVPAREAIHSDADLAHALLALAPQFAVYLMSFLTLGIFWVGQQSQLNRLERSNRNFTWLNLAFLFCVTVMPFSTRLLAEFVEHRWALAAYWFNIFTLGAVLYASWACAMRAKLVRDDVTFEIAQAVCHRIIIAQSLYAFGALLCFIGTTYSIAFIVLVQLNYAIAPAQWFRKSSPE